jgi:hypothetical protein
MGTQYFSKAFFLPNKKIENNFLLSLGWPTETTGPWSLSASADSMGKGEPARLGALAHGRLA